MSVWSDLSHISNSDSPGSRTGKPGSEITEDELNLVIKKLKGEAG
jgi:hypothetical protein